MDEDLQIFILLLGPLQSVHTHTHTHTRPGHLLFKRIFSLKYFSMLEIFLLRNVRMSAFMYTLSPCAYTDLNYQLPGRFQIFIVPPRQICAYDHRLCKNSVYFAEDLRTPPNGTVSNVLPGYSRAERSGSSTILGAANS